MSLRSPWRPCTTVPRYRGVDAYQDTALPPENWKHRLSDTSAKGALNRDTYVAPVTLTNSLRSPSFLEIRDCRKDGGDGREYKPSRRNRPPRAIKGKARTIVQFLRNEKDRAIKRERRAVQNIVDIDRVVGSGGESESEIIRLGAGAESRCRLLGLCRPATPHYARRVLKYMPFASPEVWLFLLMCRCVFPPTMSAAPVLCTVYYERSARKGKTRYVIEAPQQFDAARITRK